MDGAQFTKGFTFPAHKRLMDWLSSISDAIKTRALRSSTLTGIIADSNISWTSDDRIFRIFHCYIKATICRIT